MLAMSAIRIEELAPDLWRYWIPCPVCDGEGHYDVTLPPRPTDLSPRERRVRCGACESGLYEVERHIDDAMERAAEDVGFNADEWPDRYLSEVEDHRDHQVEVWSRNGGAPVRIVVDHTRAAEKRDKESRRWT